MAPIPRSSTAKAITQINRLLILLTWLIFLLKNCFIAKSSQVKLVITLQVILEKTSKNCNNFFQVDFCARKD